MVEKKKNGTNEPHIDHDHTPLFSVVETLFTFPGLLGAMSTCPLSSSAWVVHERGIRGPSGRILCSERIFLAWRPDGELWDQGRWYRACDLIDESERSQQLRVLYGNEYRKNKQLTSGISYLRCRLKYRLMHRKLKTNVKKQHDKLVTKGWLSCDRRLRAASLFS